MHEVFERVFLATKLFSASGSDHSSVLYLFRLKDDSLSI